MRKIDVAFIGGGNMATSLIGGLLSNGLPTDRITVSDPAEAQLERLRARFGVKTTSSNAAALSAADVGVLAVKPQQLARVAEEIAPVLKSDRKLMISIAAGIRLKDLQRWLGTSCAVVRAMPNRPALVGAGVTALVAGQSVTPQERSDSESILGACGKTVWLGDESGMDAVTAISGSGPAYFFLLIEALEQSGIELGLPPATARLLATETARGAGRMAALGPEPPAELRMQVTSAGGTTAAALAVLEQADVRGIFSKAVTAAARRSAELAEQYG